MPRVLPFSGRSWRLVPPLLLFLVVLAAAVAIMRGGITLDMLVRHRAEIATFVAAHRAAAVLAYVGLYIVTVAVSIPGASLLTVTGGFLFGIWLGTAASVFGATAGATVLFLIARSAVGEPLLKRAGRRTAELAHGFRQNAFSYLLFLRLVPAFPFFLVNLVPALAGVRLAPFVLATALGVIPAGFVYALAGTGLDSIIAAQQRAYAACLGRGETGCTLAFEPRDVLTPQMVAALIGLALLALLPVLVRHWRRRRRAAD